MNGEHTVAHRNPDTNIYGMRNYGDATQGITFPPSNKGLGNNSKGSIKYTTSSIKYTTTNHSQSRRTPRDGTRDLALGAVTDRIPALRVSRIIVLTL